MDPSRTCYLAVISAGHDEAMPNTKSVLQMALGRSVQAADADVKREEIPVDCVLSNPYQPRTQVDRDQWEILELKANIRQHGLLHPIIVTPSVEEPDKYFTLIAGERRLLAVRELRKEDERFARIPATVIRMKDPAARDTELMCKSLSENLFRANLETAETAKAIARLKEVSGWTYEAIAGRMGLHVQRVQELAVIARHEPVMEAIKSGKITKRQAIEIGRAAADGQLALRLVNDAAHGNHLTAKRVARGPKRPRRGDLRNDEPREKTPPDTIDVDKLPIAQLQGRGRVPRDEIYEAVRLTCLFVGWSQPQRPGNGV